MKKIAQTTLLLLLTAISSAGVMPGMPATTRAYAATLSGNITSHTVITGSNEISARTGLNITNSATFVSNGTLYNYGSLATASGSYLYNAGGSTLYNYGSLAVASSGEFHNYGTLYNYGTLTNSGKLYYTDLLLNNYGTLTLTSTGHLFTALLVGRPLINNYGTLQLGGSKYFDGTLNQSGGTIDFTYDNATRTSSYRTLTLSPSGAGTALSGTGKMKINTNLAGGTGDSLDAESADSGTALAVSVTYDPLMASNTSLGTVYSGNGYAVATGYGAGDITLTGATSEYGAYSYTPTFTGTTLTSLTAGVGTNTKAAAGSAAAQSNVMQTSVNHLKKRLGELRNAPDAENGIWTRVYSGEITNSKYDSVTSEYSGMQLGYDKKKDVKNGKTYTGAAFSYTDADNTFTRGSGNSKAYDLALYHTWIGDSGHYYDLIAKRGRLDSDYQVTDLSSNYSSAAYKTWTDSLSAEYGYRKQLPNRWYLEPQAELTYGHINGVNYTTTSGLSVNQEAIDRLIGRLGVETGRSFNQGNSNYYATLSALHEFKDQENLQAGTLHYSEDMSGTWGELLLGYSAKMSDHSNSFVNVEKLFGKDVTSNWQINAGLRFGF